MKNYLPETIYFLIVILLCSNLYLFNQNNSLNVKLDSLSKNLKINKNEGSQELKYNSLREDYLTKRIDDNFNVLLIVFPLLLTVFGGLTFFGIRREFAISQEKIQKENREQVERYQKEIDHIKEIESELNFAISDITIERVRTEILASETFEDKELILTDIIEGYLYAIYKITLGVNLKNNLGDRFIVQCNNDIKYYLDKIINEIEKYYQNEKDTLTFNNLTYKDYLDIREALGKNVNQKILEKLSYIITKTDFAERV